MFEWLWECMIISFKSSIGIFCWLFAVIIICVVIGMVKMILNKKRNNI